MIGMDYSTCTWTFSNVYISYLNYNDPILKTGLNRLSLPENSETVINQIVFYVVDVKKTTYMFMQDYIWVTVKKSWHFFRSTVKVNSTNQSTIGTENSGAIIGISTGFKILGDEGGKGTTIGFWGGPGRFFGNV